MGNRQEEKINVYTRSKHLAMDQLEQMQYLCRRIAIIPSVRSQTLGVNHEKYKCKLQELTLTSVSLINMQVFQSGNVKVSSQ